MRKLVMCATVLALILAAAPAFAGELMTELRRLVVESGLTPWTHGAVPLNETLRDRNGKDTTLKQFFTGGNVVVVTMFVSG